jgi:hypothetical protein
MRQLSHIEINLTLVDLIKILENLYNSIEKTNDNKIKNIYRILDKSKDAISLSESSQSKISTKIKLRHDQWIKIIECCQLDEQIIDYIERKINLRKKYQQNIIHQS